MTTTLPTAITLLLTFPVTAAAASTTEWVQQNDVKATAGGWVATGVDPFLVAKLLQPAPTDAHCLLFDLRVSQPIRLQVLWAGAEPHWRGDCLLERDIPALEETKFFAINLNRNDTYHGARHIRLDPGNVAGVEFEVCNVRLVPPGAVPEELLPGLINFHCYTSKLHYLPDERIEFRAVLDADCYPDRKSAKVLEVELRDEHKRKRAAACHHYGLRPGLRFKGIQGVLDVEQPLEPGRYTLLATSRDLRSGRVLRTTHVFGVQGSDDPFVYETPFKFVKDFTIIRGPDERWHIFSITGDFFANHDWMPDGQERTFSHGSSADLRHWTIHPPVISVSDATHADGRHHFKNRNVWAPHIIRHDRKYWMFYTSVNEHVSQSISLATSEDLFHWTEHERNPVLTLESVEWADWARDRWADCRDACVLKVGDRFHMYVTAAAHPPGDRGVVVVAESTDLTNWSNPRIAVRRNIISESPQVWQFGDSFYMTTSSLGGTTYVSDHPVEGWTQRDFPRPPIQAREKYVDTSGSYAEEVRPLSDGSWLVAGLTWRHWGNSIYLFRMKYEGDLPAVYESPWQTRLSLRECAEVSGETTPSGL